MSVISYAYVIICVYTYMHEWILGQILSKGSDQRCRISVKDNPGSALRIKMVGMSGMVGMRVSLGFVSMGFFRVSIGFFLKGFLRDL